MSMRVAGFLSVIHLAGWRFGSNDRLSSGKITPKVI
jgi:hypothetical protein